MNPDDYFLIKQLRRASMLPGSWAKRFIRSLDKLTIEHELSGKQVAYLHAIAWAYRRQIVGPVDEKWETGITSPSKKKAADDEIDKLQKWSQSCQK